MPVSPQIVGRCITKMVSDVAEQQTVAVKHSF